MRLFITIGRKHDEESFSVLSGPEVAADEQKKAFKSIVVGEHDYSEIQLWSSSGGMVKRKKFAPPEKPLEEMTIPQLKDLATREQIELTGASTKAEIVAAIEYGRMVNASKTDPTQLENLTIAQLEDLAKNEGIDLAGAKSKQEHIDAITKGRVEKSSQPDEGEFPTE